MLIYLVGGILNLLRQVVGHDSFKESHFIHLCDLVVIFLIVILLYKAPSFSRSFARGYFLFGQALTYVYTWNKMIEE
jgi:hypothetical protein